MDHKEQINEFRKRLDELVSWFAKEFTEITYAAIIGVLVMKAMELFEQSKK